MIFEHECIWQVLSIILLLLGLVRLILPSKPKCSRFSSRLGSMRSKGQRHKVALRAQRRKTRQLEARPPTTRPPTTPTMGRLSLAPFFLIFFVLQFFCSTFPVHLCLDSWPKWVCFLLTSKEILQISYIGLVLFSLFSLLYYIVRCCSQPRTPVARREPRRLSKKRLSKKKNKKPRQDRHKRFALSKFERAWRRNRNGLDPFDSSKRANRKHCVPFPTQEFERVWEAKKALFAPRFLCKHSIILIFVILSILGVASGYSESFLGIYIRKLGMCDILGAATISTCSAVISAASFFFVAKLFPKRLWWLAVVLYLPVVVAAASNGTAPRATPALAVAFAAVVVAGAAKVRLS